MYKLVILAASLWGLVHAVGALKKANTMKRVRLARLERILEMSKTGDLVLFRWNTVDALHEVFTSFTHVGMVVDIMGEKHILETHMEGDAVNIGVMDGGVHMYPFKQRVSAYDGEVFLLVRDQDIDETTEETFKLVTLPQLYDIPFDDAHRDHFKHYCIPNMLCSWCMTRPDVRPGMFCSEFVGHLLKELKLQGSGFETGCLTPGDFVNIQNEQGKVYGHLFLILK